MESHKPFEQDRSGSLARTIAGKFIAGLKFVGAQLATADLNPHEGRYRGSIMPVEYMDIPDEPPSDDTI